MAEAKKSREEKLNEAVREVSELLVKEPQALTLLLTNKDGRSAYSWAVNTPKARGIRSKAKKILETLWQSGDYNFEEIAVKLRVQPLDVQTLLDEQFRQNHNIK